MDPTQSTGLSDSLLKSKENVGQFSSFENPSPRRNDFVLESPLTFYFCIFFKIGKMK